MTFKDVTFLAFNEIVVRTWFLVLSIVFFVWPTSAYADYESAKRHFGSLNADTRVSLTLGLIATGDFVSLYEFGFTKRYYNSVVAFERREGLIADGVIDARELERLNQLAGLFYEPLGFKNYTHPQAGSKLMVPRLAFDSETKIAHGLAFQRTDRNLSLSFVAYPAGEKTLTQLFDALARPSSKRTITYVRSRQEHFVASGTFRGRYFYTWMSAVPGGTTGFTVSWSPAWANAGSKISILLANSFSAFGGDEPTPPPSATPDNPRTAENSPKDEPPPQSGTGTGFKVTWEGHVLTNYHVAGRCDSIQLRKIGDIPVSAELVASDSTNDLALVKATQSISGTVAKFRGGPALRAGSDIAVFGFPLSSVLSDSGNIVTGNITSLAGLGNDSRLFQISAPVQPGNSGGPVLDREGSVVAIVVSKLNAIAEIGRSGDIPQNVNFAIKGNVAMNFMDGTGVAYQRQDTGQQLETPAIADLARSFTFLIECRN